MNLSKTIISLGTLCLLGLGTISCSNTEIGLGVGAAVGGIIGYKSGQRHSEPRYNCDNNYYDQTCRGYNRYNRYDYNFESSQLQAKDQNQSEVATVAQKYNITDEAAELIVTSLHKAERQDYSGLKTLGLSKADALAIFRNQPLNPESISALGENLKMDNSHTAALVEHMTADIQAEKTQQGSQNNL